MSDEQAQGTGGIVSEAEAARQLLELRQVIERIGREEGRLELQVLQLESQIARYHEQAQVAQQANLEGLVKTSQERLALLRPQLANAQTQLAQIRAQHADLTRRRDHLQGQLGTLRGLQSPQMGQRQPWPTAQPFQEPSRAPERSSNPLWQNWAPAAPPWEQLPPQPRRSRRRFWFASMGIALVICASLLGVARLLLFQLPQITGSQGADTDPPVYTASGVAPANADCINDFGQSCYSPEDIQQAFRLNPLYSQGDTGKGQTIVLIGAGNTHNLQTDLQQFDKAWGLPAADLTIAFSAGPPAPYTCADGQDDLQEESALDVEWAHAIAPGAKLVLLIGSNNANTGSLQDNCYITGLEDAVRYAVNQHLGQIISMSYGSSELGDITDTLSDKDGEQQYFQAGHTLFQQAASQGITVLAATGDDGVTNPNSQTKANSVWGRPNISWPASDPNVLAVGGTRLSIDPQSSAYVGEVAWNTDTGATGGGLSTLYTEPTYQRSVPDQSLFRGMRGIPDVAFPAEGFLVYDASAPNDLSQGNPQWKHWNIVGGTSASTPCWAALIAIANQLRGKPLGLVQPALYSLGGMDMHDITLGTNTFDTVTGYQAQKGYDLVTGWGTPIAKDFLPALVQAANHLQKAGEAHS